LHPAQIVFANRVKARGDNSAQNGMTNRHHFADEISIAPFPESWKSRPVNFIG
jgi:hypothetical protein